MSEVRDELMRVHLPGICETIYPCQGCEVKRNARKARAVFGKLIATVAMAEQERKSQERKENYERTAEYRYLSILL